MSSAEIHTLETERERVERWRAETLERAGYDSVSALSLAGRPDIDLHHAIELVEQGCPPAVAVKILL